MSSLRTESTPRERLARILVVLGRSRSFWRSAAAIAAVGLALSLLVALQSKRAWRSETTVLYREGIQTQTTESPAARAARLGPKLKDLLYARPELEQVVREHDLFPEKTRRSILDGVEEMVLAVGFRARASDSYVISFTYEDPATARDVTARLADLMIEQYDRRNLDTATLTRDFLRRKLEEANAQVDEQSRALSVFLAQHPQFQWGLNDSPYAPAPLGSALPNAGVAPAPRPAPLGPADPWLARLERDLGRVEAQLYPQAPRSGPALPSATNPQKQRAAAATALAAAQAALAEKLQSVTPAHPDAVSASARVAAAKRDLAAAEAALHAPPGAPPAPAGDIDAARRSDLERERTSLHRQIAERLSRLGSGSDAARPPAPAARSGEPGKTSDVVELETEWHRLRLDLERARDEVHTLQTNTHAADLSADAVAKQGREEMQILEPAYLPTRPDRGRGRVFLIGAVITIFFALGYAASRVLLDDTLLDEGDVAALGGPPVLVVLPRPPPPALPAPAIVSAPPAAARMPDPPAHVTPPPVAVDQVAIAVPFGHAAPATVIDAPPAPRALALRPDRGLWSARGGQVLDDPEIEILATGAAPAARLRAASPEVLASLRVLRHRLEQRRGEGSLVVSVVSPGPAEGKTRLAVELALTLSEAERARVILVDGNFERPGVAAALGLALPDAASFSRQLQQRMAGRGAPWGLVALGPSLGVLAEAGPEAACPEALHSTHFEAAIAALRRSHAYVVIDGPAILGSGDANVIESVSDGVLVVVRAGSTQGTALSRAALQLGDRRLLGVVLVTGGATAGSRAS